MRSGPLYPLTNPELPSGLKPPLVFETGAGIRVPISPSGIIISSLPSFIKNRNNSHYRSLGASGGVSSVLFLMIYYSPWSGIGIMFIPIHIPSIVFGVLYIAYEYYMSKRGGTNINHDAHLWGAIYGLFFAFCIDETHGANFIDQMMHPYIHLI